MLREVADAKPRDDADELHGPLSRDAYRKAGALRHSGADLPQRYEFVKGKVVSAEVLQ